ncbi:outer membrane beta-barrel protein [Aquimarina sp. 2201CG5-10]|uniref:outer membrane beta-barrel protein n=1 Tax=Aquimarina callyspongiae TaxID=3098150 RepID=UPI002AB3D493|nr:outer membrane beta-barrel protein [Aquimarina sp. 2201CG5-10]MDY8135189.1 TonB-dependent receptor [Aquimarina sp. 2201CG5-10]
MKIKLTIILICCYWFSYGESKISGTITDHKTKELIGWADVILLKEKQVMYTTISNDQGYFEINDIKEGTYVLKINYLGYQDYTASIQVDYNMSTTIDIQLHNNEEQLGEVLVTAEKTTIEFKGDKRIINVGKDLLAAGASTENILQQVPSVDVDLSGNVSLRNDTNVIIMIDGKRSTLSSADIIAQVPANLITKIEVITNPSAKYDAEGVSGLINIITKKLKSNGGNVGINTGVGESERHHITLNANYRTQKVNVYANYNYRAPYFSSNSKTIRQTEEEIINQQTRNGFDNATVNYLKSGIDFFIDSTNTFSLSAIYAKNRHLLTNTTNTIIQDRITEEERSVLFNSNNLHDHISKELNANYRKEFNGNNHYLETDINYAYFPNEFTLDQRESSIGNVDISIDDRQKRENTITTFSADYYLNNQKGKVLELGLKTEFKNLDNTQNRIESSNNNIDDNFLYEDRVLAAYVVYEQKIKDVQLKAGLRLEDYQIDLNSNDQEEFDDHYTNLFPSFSISYSLGKNELSANYTRRISRPGIFALNPFVVETGNLSRRRGNPFLNPSFADKGEVNYNRKFEKFDINLSAFYSQVDDVIQFVFIREGDFLISTFDNVGRSKRYGIELFSKVKWFSWWNTNFSLNYYFSDFETTQFNNTNTFSQRYRIRNDFKFAKTWGVQLNGNINPKGQNLQQETQTNYRIDFAISKRFLENKGQAVLRVNDILDSSEFDFERNLSGFSERTVWKPLSRYLYLTLKYNFSFGKNTDKNRQRKQRKYSSGKVD